MHLLLIDDDHRLAELLTPFFAQHDIALHHAQDGPRGLAMAAARPYDAILLDVMMPGMDGLEVLRRLRSQSAVPVVMLTARGDETDRIVGLELGADDYVAKPFSAREVLARLRAVLRRSRPETSAERMQVGGLAIDIGGRTVSVAGQDVELTGLEFDLLVALARRVGRVVPRDTMLDAAGRGDVVVGERTVDVHISHLRGKLGDDPKNPRWIKTVRGIGYVLAKDAGL